MLIYFTLSPDDIRNFLKNPSDEVVLELLKMHNKSEIYFDKLRQFLNVQNEQTILFNQWISQHKGLVELLTTGTTNIPFQQTINWEKHALYSAFQNYLAPFFSIISEQRSSFKFSKEWANVFDYFTLLQTEDRGNIEISFLNQISNQIEHIFIRLKATQTSSDFEKELGANFTPELFKLVGLLSRQSSSIRIQFIEESLGLLYHPMISAKSAFWLVSKLDELPLQPEQKLGLNNAKNRIKNGQVRFSSKQNPKIKLWFYVSTGLVIIAFGGLWWLLNQETKIQTKLIFEGNALSYLSSAERRKVDSLIRSVDTINFTHSTNNSGYYSTVYLREPFKNERAELLHSELYDLMQQHYSGKIDSVKSEKLSGDLTLFKRVNINGNNTIEIKNTSAYHCLYMIWDERKKANVYVGHVFPKRTIRENYKEGQVILIIPGLDLGNLSNPTNHWKVHFKSIDFNYDQYLQQPFILKSAKNGKGRILIEGDKGDVIYLSDANGILDVFQ